jgi:probable phosphoglycerate mutase
VSAAKDPRFELVLVRHGLTDWNEEGRLLGRIGVRLNPRGRAQAEAAASALSSFPVAAVVSSPQPRTLETAEPIARSHALEVAIEAGLDEVWLSEAWQGKTLRELRGDVELERTLADPTYRGPSIEAVEDVQSRAVEAVERLRIDHPEETVVVVSHGDPLRAIVAHYLGLPLDHFRRIAIDNGSVSRLRFNPRGPQLVALNWKPSRGLRS